MKKSRYIFDEKKLFGSVQLKKYQYVMPDSFTKQFNSMIIWSWASHNNLLSVKSSNAQSKLLAFLVNANTVSLKEHIHQVIFNVKQWGQSHPRL